mmetsp:Transcript_26551/g.69805  ORF Transcript_26551/g.69805 Transcript_26551/m.69805 type:complete len:80 (-) Transcript_26551:155-394(-)
MPRASRTIGTLLPTRPSGASPMASSLRLTLISRIQDDFSFFVFISAIRQYMKQNAVLIISIINLSDVFRLLVELVLKCK